MNVVGSLSSSIISPLTTHFNYSIALGIIAIITAVTIMIWAFQLKQQPPEAVSNVHSQINVWKSLLAWSNSIHGRTVTRFIQSLTGYQNYLQIMVFHYKHQVSMFHYCKSQLYL